MSNRFLFIGEKRSKRAKEMGVYWEDGALAAAQLFDALVFAGVDPKKCQFVNLFEKGGIKTVRESNRIRVAMGNKVTNKLKELGIRHLKIIHPAARGRIRLKSLYMRHVADILPNSKCDFCGNNLYESNHMIGCKGYTGAALSIKTRSKS